MTGGIAMTEHALDAISLVLRERVCGHNETAEKQDKIVDVDVFVAGAEARHVAVEHHQQETRNTG